MLSIRYHILAKIHAPIYYRHMTEISNEAGVGSVVVDPAEAARIDAVAARLGEIIGYGPVRIWTREPDVDGLEYREPLRGDRDQRLIGFAGSSAVRIVQDEEGIAVTVRAETGQQTTLRPSQLAGADVDRPHGRDMPLNGKDVLTASITSANGLEVLRWPDRVIEYGLHQRIETSTHPQYRGIGIVRAYRADDRSNKPGVRDIPTLEEAKLTDPAPAVYLLSRINDETYVVTSRIGYKEGRVVTVRKPRHPGTEELRHVEMIDHPAGTSDEVLLKSHLDRFRSLAHTHNINAHGYPTWPMEPIEVDQLYLYMTSD